MNKRPPELEAYLKTIKNQIKKGKLPSHTMDYQVVSLWKDAKTEAVKPRVKRLKMVSTLWAAEQAWLLENP